MDRPAPRPSAMPPEARQRPQRSVEIGGVEGAYGSSRRTDIADTAEAISPTICPFDQIGPDLGGGQGTVLPQCFSRAAAPTAPAAPATTAWDAADSRRCGGRLESHR